VDVAIRPPGVASWLAASSTLLNPFLLALLAFVHVHRIGLSPGLVVITEFRLVSTSPIHYQKLPRKKVA